MKNILPLFAAAFIALTVLNPSSASALTMNAGVYTWYAWWDFPEDTYEKIDTDPGLAYGPVLSVDFNETFSLSFLFLYGNFDASGKDYSDAVLHGGYVISNEYSIDRYDGDTVINMKLNRYFKLFLGLKYSAFKYDLTSSIPTGASYTAKFKHSALGPGAGLSVTLPLSQNLFISGSLGGLYLRGSEDYSDSQGNSSSLDIKDKGYNSGASLLYYIAPASTTIILGGRYQKVKTKYEDGYTNKSRFYGVTLSAVYSFSL